MHTPRVGCILTAGDRGGVCSRKHKRDIAVCLALAYVIAQFRHVLLCFSSALMMSLSSCRVVSACSRAVSQGRGPLISYIADGCVLVDTRLQILEDGRIDHA